MPIIIVAGLLIVSTLLNQPVKNQEITKPTSEHQQEQGLLDLPLFKAPSIEAIVKPEPLREVPSGVRAQGIFVVNPDSGEIVMAHNEDEAWPVASLTKVMTALVFMEQEPDLNRIIALERGDMVGGTAVRVPVGTRFTANDLLHATLMGSANNAAHALARATDLSKSEFIGRMNEKAAELGLHNTKFVEPSGLNPDNKSTPAEFAVIINEALKDPVLKRVFTKTSHRLTPLNHAALNMGNTNKLLQGYNGFEMLGGKNGFTYGSAHNFTTQVKQGDLELVVVVFGDQTANQVFVTTRTLANVGFNVLAENAN